MCQILVSEMRIMTLHLFSVVAVALLLFHWLTKQIRSASMVCGPLCRRWSGHGLTMTAFWLSWNFIFNSRRKWNFHIANRPVTTVNISLFCHAITRRTTLWIRWSNLRKEHSRPQRKETSHENQPIKSFRKIVIIFWGRSRAEDWHTESLQTWTVLQASMVPTDQMIAFGTHQRICI